MVVDICVVYYLFHVRGPGAVEVPTKGRSTRQVERSKVDGAYCSVPPVSSLFAELLRADDAHARPWGLCLSVLCLLDRARLRHSMDKKRGGGGLTQVRYRHKGPIDECGMEHAE